MSVTHFEFVPGSGTSFAFAASLLTDWQSPDFIDFFLHCSLSKYPSADLKDLRHCSTSAATQGSFFNTWLLHFAFFYIEASERNDKLCEWKMIAEHDRKPLQLSLGSFCASLSLSLPPSLIRSLCLSLPFWRRENIVNWLTPIESTLWFIAQFQTAKQLNCTRSAKIHPRNTQEMWKIKCHRGTVENFHLSSSRICSLHSLLMDDGSGLYLTYLVMSCTTECVYFWKIVRKHKLYQRLTSAHSSSK